VCGDRYEARKCAKAHALDMVIQALEFEPVGPQNQWVDAMFLTAAYTKYQMYAPGPYERLKSLPFGTVLKN
jgi:hypothetical protein